MGERALLRIRHVTRYSYSHPLYYGLARLRLHPQTDSTQEVVDWNISVKGGRCGAHFRDQHGNLTDLVEFEPGIREVEILAHGQVRPLRADGLAPAATAPEWLYKLPSDLTRPGKGVEQLCAQFDAANPLAAFHRLSALILETIPFDLEVTQAAESAEAVLARGAGVCQDHSHVMIACARLLGFPARYVSGHLALNQGADQTAGHAWADVKIPDLGWVGFDVSNGYSPDDRYVRLAIGRDAREAAPVDGLTLGNHREELSVAVRVEGHPAQQ